MRRTKAKTKKSPKRTPRLPDLGHAKLSVLNTLGSPQSQRAYRFAIDDFIAWYCSEPRIPFNKTVVLRYRIQLEARHLAPATSNLRRASIRRLAYEPAAVAMFPSGRGNRSQFACLGRSASGVVRRTRRARSSVDSPTVRAEEVEWSSFCRADHSRVVGRVYQF